ncbi:MAG: hypothetical protein G01um101438_702 [Parcubacteria group bacterium Gr01-1014_38]|nr:MAG: hypothetical protein G01um101438_702 [Parcubacteria group bacterium Gr01-1014_38]
MSPREVRFFWSGSAFWFHLFLGFASAAFAQSAGDKPQNPLNRPQRNNNPLNIKYGGATKHWVEQGLATIDPVSATDGGKFLKFRDVDTGFRAARDLLRSGAYRDLDLEAALRKWSGRGYGADIIPDLKGTRIGRLTDPELDRLTDAMAHREGFYAGGYKPPRGISPDQRELIEDVSQKVSETFGGKPGVARQGERTEQPRRAPRIDVGSRVPPALQPTLPRDSPADPFVGFSASDSDQPVLGETETFGPFQFTLPKEWKIDRRDSDGVIITERGADPSIYMTLIRHPGMGPTVDYTADAIVRSMKAGLVRSPLANGGRKGIITYRPGVQIGKTTIGEERLPATWAREGGHFGIIAFDYDKSVYFSGIAGGERATRAAAVVLRSLKVRGSK